ncbi:MULTISPECIES: geranylgeranylglycerol-phosphate geranylgeranyltransferase [unclassified Flavobacterium]|uniref:geranylgeranylglycerol-phosphate geranylgeranyltransferase n=1 Tax=unclassified Flavobacterium TaxID=196869 RepID=UPI000F0C5EF6|nr:MULTISPECIES: geranylgeranylglycerol-phosphate geranylgeranyltransferase [unclassified Flavobacterium]AYN03634.1 prenyltransferase [Flavobacterium sp. 140616W15]MCD0474095.1 geranylgeranylglycerol-phosphate geranylgeranyltransferase [Flavobacterium sp. EDS]
MKYLKLIRYQNLLMLAFMQLLFRYGFLKLQNIPLALAHWQYALLVLSTVLIAAAGYVINNIFDQETDLINKPADVVVGKSISETAAYNIYVALNISGVAIGFYLSNVIMRPGFATIFILVAASLYFYATTLKQIMILGNIIVALLLSFSVIIIGVFDIFPATDAENRAQMASMFSILFDYAVFAFMINFMREIVKDIEDVNGDYNQGMNTLPIAIGTSRTAKIVFALSIIPVVFLLIYINNYFVAYNLYIATLYAFIFVLAPLLYFIAKITTAKTKKEFHNLSSILKWILFFGILSILIINLNIKYNA